MAREGNIIDLKGYEAAADDAACIATWLALAAGPRGEADLAKWPRDNIHIA